MSMVLKAFRYFFRDTGNNNYTIYDSDNNSIREKIVELFINFDRQIYHGTLGKIQITGSFTIDQLVDALPKERFYTIRATNISGHRAELRNVAIVEERKGRLVFVCKGELVLLGDDEDNVSN